MPSRSGFTLIELLVVIAIIAVLGVLTVLAINPAELQRKSRDTRRLLDLATLRRAIDLTLAEGGGPLQGSSIVGFFADSSGTRESSTSANFVGLNVAKYLAVLPDDPQHLAGSQELVTIADGVTQISRDNMRYFFASDGTRYELNAYLEAAENNSKALNTSDGGDSNIRYEIGSKAGLDLLAGP